MSEYPNYTLTQLAKLIMQFETKEGLSPAALANLKEFASSSLENASQQSVQWIWAYGCTNCGHVFNDEASFNNHACAERPHR